MPTDAPKGSFADVVASSQRGAINDDATAELKSLVAEMQQAQRLRGGEPKGKLTLELSMQLSAKGVLEVTADVKVKRPALTKTKAWLFVTKDGSLSEEDQRQGRLELGDVKDGVPSGPAKVRDIADRRMASANDT